jgi:hypothetical protein
MPTFNDTSPDDDNWPPALGRLISLALATDRSDASRLIAQYLASLSHPDHVCCLTALSGLSNAVRSDISTTFVFFLGLGFDSVIRQRVYELVVPVLFRMPLAPR